MRRPAASLTDGLVTFVDRQPIDLALAEHQWQGYVDALAAHGWAIDEVATDHACPDSTFIEDTAFVYGDIAVLARPGADSRRPEVGPVADRLGSLGYELAPIEAPGTLDGGDVLKVGHQIYVGIGGRTNADAVAQVAAILVPTGARVHGVPNPHVLHLKSALTALPDTTIIGWEPVLPPGLAGVAPMPEEAGAHVVDLGDGHLLISAAAPRSAELLAARGYSPVPVDIGEFEKLEGCVTCLSIRLRSTP